MRVYTTSNERFFEGIVRDLGDWVRLETRDQRTLLIPREQIAYIEPVAPAATQP